MICWLLVKGGRGRTRYQPVGLPVLPSLLWEERTTRTFGTVMVGQLGGLDVTVRF